MDLWRSWLSRPAYNGKVEGSNPSRSIKLIQVNINLYLLHIYVTNIGKMGLDKHFTKEHLSFLVGRNTKSTGKFIFMREMGNNKVKTSDFTLRC